MARLNLIQTGGSGSGGGTPPGSPIGSVLGNNSGVFGGMPGSLIDFVNGTLIIAPPDGGSSVVAAVSITGDDQGNDILVLNSNGGTPAITIDTSGDISLADTLSIQTGLGGGIILVGGVLDLGSVAHPTELRDINASPGSPTYLLSSTGTGVEWFPAPTLAATTVRTAQAYFGAYNATTGAFTFYQPVAADLSDTATSGNVLRGNGTSFVSAQPSPSDLSVGALTTGITAATNAIASDASTQVATDAFVQLALDLSMATAPINLGGLGPATLSFSCLGTGAKVNYIASGGAVTAITIWIPFVGSGYLAGDLVIVAGGNYDALLLITAVAGGGYPTADSILYGGTGYTSGTSNAILPN